MTPIVRRAKRISAEAANRVAVFDKHLCHIVACLDVLAYQVE
jgi:hypothetical protein